MNELYVVDTVEEVARRFRKGVRTIYRWKSQGMPVMVDGRFDLTAIEAWVRKKKGLVPPGQDSGTRADLENGASGEPDRSDASTAAVVPGGQASSGDAHDIGSAQDKDWWDKENKKYQARLRELELRKKSGELIEVAKVHDEFVARILAVKAGLLAHERSLPPELIACRTEREMADVIRKAVRALLREFARPLPPSMQSGEEHERE